VESAASLRDGGSRQGAGKSGQAATPNAAPTPAVSAIAIAPQNETRGTACQTGAPPVSAGFEPSFRHGAPAS